jgi:hypothetical protein
LVRTEHGGDVKGRADCAFLGGPLDGQTRSLGAMRFAQDHFFVIGAWIIEKSDGGAVVVRHVEGQARNPQSRWVSYSRSVYEKVKPSIPLRIEFRFLRTEVVARCAFVLPSKGRRCGNDAEPGQRFCLVHGKAA